MPPPGLWTIKDVKRGVNATKTAYLRVRLEDIVESFETNIMDWREANVWQKVRMRSTISSSSGKAL
jgi:hypothetical protein